MNILFRVDSSIEIGTGHVMRCLTLANAFRVKGANCIFVCRMLNGNLINQISKLGFVVNILPAPNDGFAVKNGQQPRHANWLQTDWRSDAQETIDSVKGQVFDLLVVDHYALDVLWEKAVRTCTKKIFIIDDLADRSHNCEILLDQNLGRSADDYFGLIDRGVISLIGPQYSLLRSEFSLIRNRTIARRENISDVKNLLVSMGGVDQHNMTEEVLNELSTCQFLPVDLRITVIMGTNSPWMQQVSDRACKLPWSTQVIAGIDNMAEVLAASDLAIGAAGVTALERCCLGLPSLMLVLAENQSSGALALHNAGAAFLLKTSKDIPNALKKLLSECYDNSRLKKMAQNASSVTDGSGVKRTLDFLMTSMLTLRAVTEADAMLLFDWANDPLNRRNSFESKIILIAQHKKWFYEHLENFDSCRMYLAMLGDEPVGQARFDRNKHGEWEIDYSLSASYRGKGLAKAFLKISLNTFALDMGCAIATLVAKVKHTNIPSCRVFKSLDFEEAEIALNFTIYRKQLNARISNENNRSGYTT